MRKWRNTHAIPKSACLRPLALALPLPLGEPEMLTLALKEGLGTPHTTKMMATRLHVGAARS